MLIIYWLLTITWKSVLENFKFGASLHLEHQYLLMVMININLNLMKTAKNIFRLYCTLLKCFNQIKTHFIITIV